SLFTALSGITAAIVGVILNLGIWFFLNTIFTEISEQFFGPLRLYIPNFNTIDWASFFLALIALFTYFKLKLSMLKVIGINIILGVIWWVTFG
ncbi:MAG: chromate transporter, partial [Bacteroidota bacterium]|nr:chromate transporter [Bacteroidota bacterium]